MLKMFAVRNTQDLCADAVDDFRKAYRRLGDPTRDDEMVQTISDFRSICDLGGEATGLDWIRSQTDLILKEAGESS